MVMNPDDVCMWNQDILGKDDDDSDKEDESECEGSRGARFTTGPRLSRCNTEPGCHIG